MTPPAPPRRRRRARGFSLLEGLVTALALALLVALVLRLFARTTRAGLAGEGEAPLALESAVLTLHRALRDAGSGPLPPALEPVQAPFDDAPPGTVLRDAAGREVPVVEGTDGLRVRGLLDGAAVALDPVDRGTGEAFARPDGSGPPGLLQREPSRARLVVHRYPSRQNPRRIWAEGAAGLGLAWGSGERAREGQAEGALDALVASLSSREPGVRLVAVCDEAGWWAVGRLVALDASRLSEGCECDAPAPWPGGCPPGAGGCSLALTLDFTDPLAVERNPKADPSALGRLGRLAWAGPLGEETFFVAREPAGGGTYLAAARLAEGGLLALRRAAEGISDLQVARELPGLVRVTVRGPAPERAPATFAVAPRALLEGGAR
ncbi:MAG: hypothetical protein EDX89_22785 [Acidobacteria bacterium]|nr:MAG: hypothetical protein EDX89_22785 [Acidobacteriota bacterium]